MRQARTFGDNIYIIEIKGSKGRWEYLHIFRDPISGEPGTKPIEVSDPTDSTGNRKWRLFMQDGNYKIYRPAMIGNDRIVFSRTISADAFENIITEREPIAPAGTSGLGAGKATGSHVHLRLNGGGANPLLYLRHKKGPPGIEFLNPSSDIYSYSGPITSILGSIRVDVLDPNSGKDIEMVDFYIDGILKPFPGETNTFRFGGMPGEGSVGITFAPGTGIGVEPTKGDTFRPKFHKILDTSGLTLGTHLLCAKTTNINSDITCERCIYIEHNLDFVRFVVRRVWSYSTYRIGKGPLIMQRTLNNSLNFDTRRFNEQTMDGPIIFLGVELPPGPSNPLVKVKGESGEPIDIQVSGSPGGTIFTGTFSSTIFSDGLHHLRITASSGTIELDADPSTPEWETGGDASFSFVVNNYPPYVIGLEAVLDLGPGTTGPTVASARWNEIDVNGQKALKFSRQDLKVEQAGTVRFYIEFSEPVSDVSVKLRDSSGLEAPLTVRSFGGIAPPYHRWEGWLNVDATLQGSNTFVITAKDMAGMPLDGFIFPTDNPNLILEKDRPRFDPTTGKCNCGVGDCYPGADEHHVLNVCIPEQGPIPPEQQIGGNLFYKVPDPKVDVDYSPDWDYLLTLPNEVRRIQ